MEPEDSRLTGQVGGYVIEGAAAQQHTEQRAEIATRSTGDEAPATHAEARLLTQVERMLAEEPTWKDRVRTIEIHLSESPCPSCAGLLLLLRSKFPSSTVRLALLQWGQRHQGKYPTDPSDIPRLKGSYRVIGP